MKNLSKKWLSAAITALFAIAQFGASALPVMAASNDPSDLKIQDIELENKLFNPYMGEEARVSFYLNQPAEITFVILEDDDDDDIVKYVKHQKHYPKGYYSLDWDGTDEYGDTVPEDKYYFELIAENSETITTEKGYFIARHKAVGFDTDTTDPRLSDAYITKTTFDPGRKEKPYFVFTLTSRADVKIAVYNQHGSMEEEVFDGNNIDAGNYVIKWDADELIGNEGYYTYKIYAENSHGYDQVTGEILAQKDYKQNKKPNILKDHVKQDNIPYRPADDNKLDIHFQLDRRADVTLEIREDGYVMDRPVKNVTLEAGSHAVYWDGLTKYDAQAEDGVYEYRLIAEAFDGKDVEYGYFSLQGSDEAYNPQGDCSGFTDVPEHSHSCEAIAWADSKGIFEGYNDGTFGASKVINRAEAMKVILEALNIQTLQSYGGNFGFHDVSPYEWFNNHLKTAVSLGIIEGFSDGSMRPYTKVTRSEALAMLLKAGKVRNGIIVPTHKYGMPYHDVAPHQWYTDIAWFAKAHGLNSNEFFFYPEQGMTRGDMADMLYRYHLAGLNQ